MKIHFNIDKITIDGISLNIRSRTQLHADIHAELTRLISSSTLSNNLFTAGSIEKIAADNITLSENNTSKIGQQVAHSVFEGLTRE